jgi:hypothetical protein
MACQRALEIGATSYSSLKSILKCGLEQNAAVVASPLSPPSEHENIRGAAYYR